MNIFLPKNKNLNRKIILIILVLIVLFALLYLISSIRQSYYSGNLRAEYQVKKGHPIRLPSYISPNSINAWMTFDYINVVFKLPSNYLKETLSINDFQYPNISLHHYARKNNLNLSQFLQNIQNSIINYSAKK